MPKRKDDAVLAALRDALDEGGDRRSPLYRWMWENHDGFAELLKGSRPNWTRLAETLAGLGFAGPGGEPLRSETVRQTWWRVRKRREEMVAASAGVPKPPPRSKPLAASVPTKAESVPASPPSRPRVVPVVPSGVTVPPETPAPPAAPSCPRHEADGAPDPDAVLEALKARLTPERRRTTRPVR